MHAQFCACMPLPLRSQCMRGDSCGYPRPEGVCPPSAQLGGGSRAEWRGFEGWLAERREQRSRGPYRSFWRSESSLEREDGRRRHARKGCSSRSSSDEEAGAAGRVNSPSVSSESTSEDSEAEGAGARAEAAAAVTSEDPASSSDESGFGPLPPGGAGGALPAAPAPAAADYGGALRPGEGAAIAAFVQSGKRVPRRGEVGLVADEIAKFEELGYVMSGSRHRRMNAIRLRKENQVYTAEEQRALLHLHEEQRVKKEEVLVGELKDLILNVKARTQKRIQREDLRG